MATRFNIAKELQTVETKRFEKQMQEKYGRAMHLQEVPLKNFVDASTGLLETRVSATFMRGAVDEAGFWSNLINVYNLSSPIEKVPIISQRDFAVRTGKIGKTALEEAGGKFTSVTLDTTDEHKYRYTYLRIDQDDVNQRNFSLIEQAIEMAGRAFAKKILTDITAHYDGIAGNTQALGGDKYFVAVMKAIALNKDDGFGCNAIVFEINDFVQAVTEETTGGTMPWLLQLQNGQPLGDNFGNSFGMSDGFVGKLFGRTPVYVVSNDSALNGEILAVDVPAASAFGFAPGGEMKLSQSINTINDLIEAKIAAKYDYANGNANAVAKVTGA